MSRSRITRGRQTESLLADYLKVHGFPDAERIAASLPGADIRNTGEVSFEAKARRSLNLPGWLRQASAREGLPVLIVRPDGYGEQKLEMWAMVMTVKDGVELLRRAGHGLSLEGDDSPGGPRVEADGE